MTHTQTRRKRAAWARLGAGALGVALAVGLPASPASAYPGMSLTGPETVRVGQPFSLQATYGPTWFAGAVIVDYYHATPEGIPTALFESQLILAPHAGATVVSMSSAITLPSVGYRWYTASFREPGSFMLPGTPVRVHVVDGTTVRTESSGVGIVDLRATLTANSTGAPLGGRPIDFTAGSRRLCTATTDADGVASCRAFGVLGSYTASFAGEEHYLASEDRDRFLF